MTKTVHKYPDAGACALNLRVGVRLSRTLNGGGDAPWFLTIGDSGSHLSIAEVRFSDEDLAHLLAAREITADCELIQSERHGLTREVGTVRAKLPTGFTAYDGDFAAVQDEWDASLSDGWKVMRETRLNHHRRSASEYRATIERWVPSDAGGAS